MLSIDMCAYLCRQHVLLGILFFLQLESCNLKLHEQSRTISDFERQVASQALTIKLLQAGKQHSVLITQHTKELTNQIGPRPAGYLRPRSAESARKPNYRISDFKSRIAASVLQEGEFSIPFPVQNSSVGARVDILNLEEQPEDSGANMMLSLGPMVVTDDEYTSTLHEEKANKPPRVQKLRMRGHRRTASTGSNVLPYVKEKEPVPNQHATLPPSHPPSSKQKPIPKYPRRPGSAGSTRPDVDVPQMQEVKSPDQIVQTAQALSQYVNTLNDDLSKESKSQQQQHQQQQGSKETTEKSGKEQKSSSGMRTGRALSQGAMQVTNFAMKIKHKYSEIRSKQANKSTDSNETTGSHEGANTSSSAVKNDSNSDQHSKGTSKSTSSTESANAVIPAQSGKVGSNTDMSNLKPEKQQAAKDLNRTESMSSTCSTLSIFSHLPSRNPSFSVYDGGESSPYSHESLEIGDSVENLQVSVNFSLYIYH